MKNVLRSLLVWLMLLALPFQGLASAAAPSCAHGTMQQPAPAATAMPAQAHGGDGHRHPAADHAAAAGAPQDSGAAAHGCGDGDGDGDDRHDGRCSACADCCVGAALAPAPALINAPPDAPAVIHPAAAGRLAAVDLALPERPPRFPLA